MAEDSLVVKRDSKRTERKRICHRRPQLPTLSSLQNPEYTEDAAAAVAWAVKHIAEYGGSPSEIYVGGHSAGGYLTLMLCLDKNT